MQYKHIKMKIQVLPQGVERINTKTLVERVGNHSGFVWKSFDCRIDYEGGITPEMAKTSIEVHWEHDSIHYCAVKEQNGRMWALTPYKIKTKKR